MSDPLIEAAAKVIWETSRADESTISATGAKIVAKALNDAGILAYQDRLSKARWQRTCAQIDRDRLASLLQMRTEALSRVVAENEQLRATAARVEALIGRWESPGLVCECGHNLGQHNDNGCYERITYQPELIVCDCPLTDDRYEDDFAIRDLRTALHPEETP